MSLVKAEVTRSGWLQILRICMSTLFSLPMAVEEEPVPSRSASARISSLSLPSTSCWLSARCSGVMSAYRMISILRGRLISTSLLSRLSTKGLRMACSLDTTWLRCSAARISRSAPSCPTMELKSNQASKSDMEEKTSGMRKLSSDHSSLRLFCSGVPDSSSLFSAGMVLSSRMSLHWKFFRRCPSSTTMYLNLNLDRNLTSAITISYEVMMTGKSAG
mmetsp:Transcript_31717/g.80864  ORF Transcript_31717/g.80864 Transcript_31717/m.80864 type:complete len:218 (-) Transcript_31717:1047-1700(-)